MPESDQLLVKLILYGILPLWGICGFIDWCCHRATFIERTSGIKETAIHSIMGIQLGIPILLGLMFKVNILILCIFFVAWLLHEFAAHWDVHYASSLRRISLWEMHVHNYMATIPLYLLMLVIVLNWDVVMKAVEGDWAGQFSFERVEAPRGSSNYLTGYLTFMGLLCVLPYFEENLRCVRVALQARSGRQ